MMEPYILIIIATVRGSVDVEKFEFLGQATCQNAARLMVEESRGHIADVVAICVPK